MTTTIINPPHLFNMNRLILLAGVTMAFALAGCKSERNPGIEFAPQMYESIPLEPYRQVSGYELSEKDPRTTVESKRTLRTPPVGTVAQGKADWYYPYPKTNEGYELAGKEWRSPLAFTEENVAVGKEVYTKMCSHCHGANGKGDGPIIAAGKFPNPPSYDSQRIKDLSEGKIYHSIFHGINIMGAHGSQMTPTEIWQVVQYIRTGRGEKPDGSIAAAEAPAKADAKPAKPATTN